MVSAHYSHQRDMAIMFLDSELLETMRTVITRLLVEDTGISNIAPVQEVEKIDPAADWQDPYV